MTLAEAQAKINAREFTLWRAAYKLEPWGEDRADFRAARIAQYIASTNGWNLTFTEALKHFDFYDYDEPPAPFKEKFRAFFNVNAHFLGVSQLGAGKPRGAK
ncbi:MAG: hypothetical protein FWD61_03335 [Phycisphaerales bacterium]|nr:hypothetical protein [Phycisphaerales bacterium]